jgi:hypothetical protein
VSLDGPRGGVTFNAMLDTQRLNKQAQDVFDVMADGKWHSLSEISKITGHPEASVSARLRDFRKQRFGGHRVERARIFSGWWLYQLIKQPTTCTLTDIRRDP